MHNRNCSWLNPTRHHHTSLRRSSRQVDSRHHWRHDRNRTGAHDPTRAGDNLAARRATNVATQLATIGGTTPGRAWVRGGTRDRFETKLATINNPTTIRDALATENATESHRRPRRSTPMDTHFNETLNCDREFLLRRSRRGPATQWRHHTRHKSHQCSQ